MHTCREVQTAAVTIISYKPLSDLNFARHTGQLHALSPFGPGLQTLDIIQSTNKQVTKHIMRKVWSNLCSIFIIISS